jgi:hypothetical protein
VRTVLAAAVLALSAGSALADVKTQERTQVKFEGMLGKMIGMFGGKAAREGLVSSVAVKGDRKMTITGDDAELIDLAEEKVYDIDLKKKTYTVMTFEQLREKFREAQKKAQEQSAKQKEETAKRDEKAEEPQFEIDFNMKETGQRRAIAGHDCREMLMTVTVRQKGQTLEQAGGLVMESSSWLAADVPAMKERQDFDLRFAQKVYGEMFSAADREQMMATAMAMYPGMTAAMERMKKENVNMSGTPLLTTLTMQAVKGAQQVAAEKEQAKGEPESSAPPTNVSGLMGGFAKKMMKKKEPTADQAGQAGQNPNRATIMTSTMEVTEISTSVAAADLAVPAGFKQEK